MQKNVYADGTPLTNYPVPPIWITYIEVQTISPAVHTCIWITQVSFLFKVQIKCANQLSMKQ